MYGKEAKSTAEDLKITYKEAVRIIDTFFEAFPKVKTYIDRTIAKAKITGYVETAWGRKRRLPDLMLQEYEFYYAEPKIKDFDPLSFDNNSEMSTVVEEHIQDEYWNALHTAKGWKQFNAIKERARAAGIIIKDNNKKIQDAKRQAMNSPIQGSAGDMVKNAMVYIRNYKFIENKPNKNSYDLELVKLAKEFESLGGKLLIQVHDELLAEAPIKNVFRVSEIMSEIMVKSAADVISVSMRCDTVVLDRWNGNKMKEVA
jgi:DNA polymerase I-like protein with 3'-5' exonuclease and polymerase domains